jgi:hypothetical protein
MNVKMCGGKLLWDTTLLKSSSGGTQEHSETEVTKARLRAGFGIRDLPVQFRSINYSSGMFGMLVLMTEECVYAYPHL